MKAKGNVDATKTHSKSIPPQRRVRYLPFALTPAEVRKKIPPPTVNCESCLSHSQQWAEMFNTLCDKYEEISSQLKENQIQLHIAKAAVKKNQRAAHKMRKEYSHAEVQTETHFLENATQTDGIENRVENGSQTETHVWENATQTDGTENDIENGSQAEVLGVESATLTERIEDHVENESRSFFKSVTQLDHSYATTKPFSCKYCLTKFTRKNGRNKHYAICKARQTSNSNSSDDDEEDLSENNQDLYVCRVCAKQYTYDKMRKHYLQFINSSGSRKNRNGHGEVSLSTHISYMNELKANKPKKKWENSPSSQC